MELGRIDLRKVVEAAQAGETMREVAQECGLIEVIAKAMAVLGDKHAVTISMDTVENDSVEDDLFMVFTTDGEPLSNEMIEEIHAIMAEMNEALEEES